MARNERASGESGGGLSGGGGEGGGGGGGAVREILNGAAVDGIVAPRRGHIASVAGGGRGSGGAVGVVSDAGSAYTPSDAVVQEPGVTCGSGSLSAAWLGEC